MSTIPDNPVDATKPETQPAIPTTADQRAAHTNINSAFAAAKSDIEGLEGSVVTQDGAGADNSFAYWSTYATRHLAAVTATDKGAPPFAMIYRDSLNAWKERTSEQLAFDAGYFLSYGGFANQYFSQSQMFYSTAGAGFFIDGAATASLTLQDRGSSAGTRAARLQVAGNEIRFDLLTDITYTLPVDGAGGSLAGGIPVATYLAVDMATGNVDAKIGNILEQGARVYSPNNPPPGGGVTNPPSLKGELWGHDGTGNVRIPAGTDGQVLVARNAAPSGTQFETATGIGDVTSTNNTVDGEVQVGDGPVKGIKGAGFQADNVYHTGNLPPYSTVENEQTPLPQQPALDFDAGLFAFDVVNTTRVILNLDNLAKESPSGDPEAAQWVYHGQGQGARTRTTPQMRADFGFLSAQHTADIKEVGYPLTPTNVPGTPLTPDPAANLAYYSTLTGALTISLSGFTKDGMTIIYLPNSVTASSFTGGTTVGDTSDPGTGDRTVTLTRINGTIFHQWNPSG